MFGWLKKVIVWVGGRIGGEREVKSLEGSAELNEYSEIAQSGVLFALSTASGIPAADRAVISDVVRGISPTSDPATYTGALIAGLNSIPAGRVAPGVIPLAELIIETASATVIAGHPDPASLLTTATPPATQQNNATEQNNAAVEQGTAFVGGNQPDPTTLQEA